VTFILSFGSSQNEPVHFHVRAVDGVFVAVTVGGLQQHSVLRVVSAGFLGHGRRARLKVPGSISQGFGSTPSRPNSAQAPE
jgi:hypothetical protein